MEKTSTLKKIRVQDCQASRREDVDEILAKIDDKAESDQILVSNMGDSFSCGVK